MAIRRFGFLLLAFLAAFPAFGQDVLIQPRFVEGQRILLELEKGRKDARMDTAIRTQVTLTVLEATAEGSVIDWQSGETRLERVPEEMRLMLASMSALLEGLHLECQYNAKGEFTGLRNQAEVSEKLSAAVARMIDDAIESAPEGAEPEKMRPMMEQMLRPDLVLASATKDARFFAGLAGLEIAPGETVTLNAQFASPIGGVLDTKIRITAGEIDKAAGTFLVDWVSVPTPESLAEATRAFLRRSLRTDDAAKIEQAMDQVDFSLSDKTNYTIDLEHGWPRTLKNVRTTVLGPQSRIDRFTLTVVGVEGP